MELNFKKIFLISLLLLILTVGVVSASNTTDELSISDFPQDSIDIPVDEELSVSDESSILSQDLSDDDVIVEAPENNEIKACQQHEIFVKLPNDAKGTITSHIYYDEGDFGEEEYDVEDGMASIPIKFDSFGLHNIALDYSGDENYAGKLIWSRTYNVTDFIMSVTYPEDIYYGEEATLYVDLPYEVEGKLKLNLNDNFYHTVSSFSDDYEFPIYNLKLGENKFTITYYSGNYHDVTVEGTFLAIPMINVPSYAYYNKEYNVSLALPNDAKGSLVVDFNGKTYTSKMNNGKASVSLPTDLDLDYYLITANYTGSDYDVEGAYYAVPLCPNLDFSKFMWVEDSNSITVYGPKSMKGTLDVIVDGDSKTVEISDGKAIIPLNGLSVGDHYFYLYYEKEDYLFDAQEYFEISGINPNINLELEFINETRANEPFEISTNIPIDGDGILYVYVDGALAENYVSWGFANYAYIDPSNLELGQHTVKLEYKNDSYYRDVSKTAKFSVVDVKIVIPDSIVYDQGMDYVDVYITPEVRGNISIYVDGEKFKNIPITPAYYGKDGYGYDYYVVLDSLDMGLHKIEIAYSGDGTHQEKSKAVDVNVSYAIGLDEGDYRYGDGELRIYLPQDATNKITVKIDGKAFENIVYYIEGGYRDIYLNISDLEYGNHTVEVTYPGDGRYYPLTVSGEFNVCYEIEMRIPNVYMESNTYVSLKLPSNATGNLRAQLDNKDWYEVPLKNGFANISFGYLKPGTHSIFAYYTGDDYSVNDFSGKYDIGPIFKYEECTLNEAGYVYLELPIDAIGNLLVYVDGELYKKSKLVNGKANVTVALKVDGGHELKLFYDGSDYRSIDYIIWQIPFLDEDIPLYKGDSISFNLPKDGTGKLSIIINGKTYTPEIVDGYANFTPDNLVIGENTLDIIYSGDSQYGNYGDDGWVFTVKPKVSIADKRVKLTPISGAILSEYINISTSDFMTIDLESDFNGEYVVVIDNDYYAKGRFVNGLANISLSKANLGLQEIYVDYEYENGKHDFINFYADIKQSPKLSLTANDVYVGQKVDIAVDVGDAKGNVNLNVNNKSYTLKLVNGKATKSISNLAVGKYEISVAYGGDEQYMDGVKTINVKVKEKISPNLNINVLTTANAKNTAIKVSADKNINANVIVSVNGSNYTVKLVNGSGKLTIPTALTTGNYIATAIYKGNAKFLMQNATKAFKIYPVKISAKAKSVLYTSKGKYSVTVYGANGKVASGVYVAFKIGKKQVAKVKTSAKGVASYVVTKTPGTYKITATALGKKATKKLTVTHVVTLKSVKVKRSAKKLVLTATLKKVNKKYIVKKTVTFKFNGKKYTAKTNKKGVATVTIKKAALKKLKVGKTVKYQATYLKDTVKRSVKVKK